MKYVRNPNPVVIVDFDPAWPVLFGEMKQVYEESLHGLIESVEHVGSTAVPGLAAKPILDIDLVIRSRGVLSDVARRLESLGYRHEGDRGIEGREAFAQVAGAQTPRDGSGRTWPSHHLYVCAVDCAALREHLAFREFLRANPEKAHEYGALKRSLAEALGNNREAYTEGKTEFIRSVLRSCID